MMTSTTSAVALAIGVQGTEIETRKRWINEEITRLHYNSAGELCSSPTCTFCINRQEYEIDYMYCSMCGRKPKPCDYNEIKRPVLHRFQRTPRSYGLISLFCRGGQCFENYGKCLGTTTADLSNGLPYIWYKVKTTDKYYCKVPKRREDPEGRLSDLICMYCGGKHSNVISHPLVPKKYDATSFCRNERCFSTFCFYVDNMAKLQVPFGLQTSLEGDYYNDNTVATTAKEPKSVKKASASHYHSVTLTIPIMSERDEFTHEDVCVWCPEADDSTASFKNVLLGAFLDYNAICDHAKLLKAVRCIKELEQKTLKTSKISTKTSKIS